VSGLDEFGSVSLWRGFYMTTDQVRAILRRYCEFDENGRHKNGTDRASNHNYSEFYANIHTDEERQNVKLLMEVGIADGSGMLAFRELYQAATIVGLDKENCACERGPRLEFHVGNQRNQADCERAAAGRLFDVIVEDAYHSTENTLLTLFWLWPFVAPGGLYIVEEWADICSHWANVRLLWPDADIVPTTGPFGGTEPLVVFRKQGIGERVTRGW
jgi:hypothetical protein